MTLGKHLLTVLETDVLDHVFAEDGVEGVRGQREPARRIQAQLARRESILALEQNISKFSDPFMRTVYRFVIDGVEGGDLVAALDLEGIEASTGSACTTGSVEPSHVLLAMGIRALFATFGLDLSGSDLIFAARTPVAAYVVGIVVTVVAAYVPARRSARIAPVAALRDDVAMPESALHWRLILGIALIVAGAGGMLAGLYADVPSPGWWVGGGILAVLLGVAGAAPVISRPVVTLATAVYRRVYGPVGNLAGQNSLRNPRRTTTAAKSRAAATERGRQIAGYIDKILKGAKPEIAHDLSALREPIDELPVDGEMREQVVTVGKTGIIESLDRTTGEWLWHVETAPQNVVLSIDPEARIAVVQPGVVHELRGTHFLGQTRQRYVVGRLHFCVTVHFTSLLQRKRPPIGDLCWSFLTEPRLELVALAVRRDRQSRLAGHHLRIAVLAAPHFRRAVPRPLNAAHGVVGLV